MKIYPSRVTEGLEIYDSSTYNPQKPLFGLPGMTVGRDAPRPDYIAVDENMLSKHILLLGGIGSGKTNTMNFLVESVRRSMTANDVAIIFDTKGDYYDRFHRPGDIIISNDSTAAGENGGPDYWNIFREVMIDDRVEENVQEIARTLFADKIEKSSQPFFPSAAKDLFAAAMLEMIRNPKAAAVRNNHTLRSFFNSVTPEVMTGILQKYPDLKAMESYIKDPTSGQTLGVFAELQQEIRDIFIGNFAKEGGISIRELVKNKGRKVIFVEYDVSLGETLSPIYRLLIDMAIKQALCRKNGEAGSVYFFLDELRLLPHLQHLDDGVNFGRSLGAKFIAGIQNISQLNAAYGEDTATSLLAGFGTNICFRVNDKVSREYVKGLYGSCMKLNTFDSAVGNRGVTENLREALVIEDHDVTELQVGQAIVSILNCPPFRFQFKEWNK